jgi:hypothetical protein
MDLCGVVSKMDLCGVVSKMDLCGVVSKMDLCGVVFAEVACWPYQTISVRRLDKIR